MRGARDQVAPVACAFVALSAKGTPPRSISTIFPAAFVFGTRRPAKHALEASESVKKFGEFARGFEKHEGAWASEGRIEPRPPTWR